MTKNKQYKRQKRLKVVWKIASKTSSFLKASRQIRKATFSGRAKISKGFVSRVLKLPQNRKSSTNVFNSWTLWPNLAKISILLYYLGLVSIWQHFELTLVISMIGIGQMFTVVKGQILKNDVAIWSHCSWTIFGNFSQIFN